MLVLAMSRLLSTRTASAWQVACNHGCCAVCRPALSPVEMATSVKRLHSVNGSSLAASLAARASSASGLAASLLPCEMHYIEL